MLEVAQVHVVRHKVRAEGKSRRSVAKELGISRNTVLRYLRDEVVPGVRTELEPRDRPVLDAVQGDVEEILAKSRVTTKQRLTAGRVVELLRERGKEASERSVRRLMAEWKRRHAEVHVPLEYVVGDLAEVDFFEVIVVVDGVERKAWMFLMRLMYSGRDFARLYDWQDQSAFLDGHVRAFEHFGGVPKRVLYDNLKAAVRRVLVGSERELNDRFVELAAHYGFEPRFARPRRGDDKGGVEARGKIVRWHHLTPVPEGPTIEAISERLLERLDGTLERPRRRGGATVRALWEGEKVAMMALPSVPHDPSLYDELRVDGQAQVRVRAARYSVPCAWAGKRVRVRLFADRVVVWCDAGRVERKRVAANAKNIQYRDYLPELARKAQAVEQIGDVLAAQLGGSFERAWKRLCVDHGRRDAARRYRTVIDGILRLGEDAVRGLLETALARGGDVVLACRAPVEDKPPCEVPVALLRAVEVSSLAIYDRLGGAR